MSDLTREEISRLLVRASSFTSKQDGEALQQENERLRAAMQEFVDRLDRGEVRSRYTYAKFKQLLETGDHE